MSACERIQDELLDGTWDHEHLAGCAECRVLAEALARVDGALARGPRTERAPATLLPAVRARIVERQLARGQRWLLLAAAVSTTVAVGAGAVLWRLAPGLEWSAGSEPSGTSPTPFLVEALNALAGSLPAMSLLLALAGAAAIRLLAEEI